MTRGIFVGILICLLGLLVVFDLAVSEPPNPYNALPPLALGSGQVGAGALCTTGGR